MERNEHAGISWISAQAAGWVLMPLVAELVCGDGNEFIVGILCIRCACDIPGEICTGAQGRTQGGM